jgi:hypothetical protein
MRSSYRALADFHDTGWRTGLFRALLIAALAAGATAAPVAILRIVLSWRMGYLLPLAFLAALIGVFDTLRLGRPDWRDRRRVAFRLGEIVLLLLVAQVVIWSAATGWPSLAVFGTWLRHPARFLTGQWIATGLLVLAAWWLAVQVTGDFLDLAIQPDEVAVRQSHAWGQPASQWRVFRPVGRDEIVGRFVKRWAWGGVALVLLAALSGLSVTEDVASLLRFSFSRLGLPPDVVVALLCYFLAGLLLLSDARLAVLRGRWYNEGTETAPDVLQRWHVTSLLALLVVAGVALLLPLGPTSWLGQAVEWVIALVMRIAMALFLLFSLLLSLLFYPLRFLFKPGEEGAIAPPPATAAGPPAQAGATASAPGEFGGILLWAVVVLVGGYLIAIYLRTHGRLPGVGASWFGGLRLWWRRGRARVAQAVRLRAVALRARRGRRSDFSAGVAPTDFPVRLGGLPARAQVRHFYLATLRRADTRGLRRPPHRTPLEFADDLDVNWPDAAPDVQELTRTFVDARYSTREIESSEVRRAQSAWQRLIAALDHPRQPDATRRA